MTPRSALSAFLLLHSLLAAQSGPTAGLPVREVTVFKDGHAYVVREAPLAADAGGRVVLDELPAPVLGTFWPYATGGARLVAAVAGRQAVPLDTPVADLRQLVQANAGKDVTVVLHNAEKVEGRLLPSAGDLVLVATGENTRALPLGHVQSLSVQGDFVPAVRSEQHKERLTLQVAGGGPEAKVGVMYVQRGLRWIPAYRLDIDGAGKVRIELEATLVNDLVDLDRAAVHLVVGVPKFEFEGLVDPISLQQEVAAVARGMREMQFSNLLSNSLMTQSSGRDQAEGVGGGAQDPAVAGADRNEDLYIYSLRDVTLKKGERMVLPIAAFEATYRDLYRLDVPLAPPAEVRDGAQDQRAMQLLRELAAPKARHVLRLRNTGEAPFTTAPALVLQKGRVLAQGRLRYTPSGAETDLEINTAVDVHVDVESAEVRRLPGALQIDGNRYSRVDLAGAIVLRNDKKQAIELEITRRVLGIVDEAGQGGERRQLDPGRLWEDAAPPVWWSWWSWPWWWFHHSGFGEVRWKLRLEPGASTKLEASWHYFWR